MPDQPPPLPYPDPPLTDGVAVLRRWERDDLGCVEEATQDPLHTERDHRPGDVHAQRWSGVDRAAVVAARRGLGTLTSDCRRGLERGTGRGRVDGGKPGTVEIGYWLIPRARGRGFASRAVALLARWALTEASLARVEALVVPDNVASQRVLEKAGFRREGHLRSYLELERQRADALIYSLLPSDLS